MYTKDWFSQRISDWKRWLAPLIGQPITALEIGSFEGRSAVWLLENVLTHPASRLDCIDSYTFPPYYTRPVDPDQSLALFRVNTAKYESKITLHLGASQEILRHPSFHERRYDLIYLDGSHEACDVLEDAVLTWRMLRPKGVLIFDDYGWKRLAKGPKLAIDAFLEIFSGYDLLGRGFQVAVRKSEGT